MNLIYGISIISVLVILILIVLIIFIFKKKKRKPINEQENQILSFYCVKEFLDMYEGLKKSPYKINDYDYSGIYILYNLNHNKVYVGQSKGVIKRVNNHFKANGNGDLYADYKYGCQFQISIVKCNENELNEIERYYIHQYGSHLYGYNKTKGNK